MKLRGVGNLLSQSTVLPTVETQVWLYVTHEATVVTMTFTSMLALFATLIYASAGHSVSEGVNRTAVANGTLEHLLCNSTLETASTITLEPNVTYTISHNQFCVVENLTSLVIRGKSPEHPAVIKCIPENSSISVSSGFGFVNIGNIIIENVHVENCGGMITPAAVRSINDSYFYFGPGQSTVFLFSLCFDLQLQNITITNYTGYAVIGVNIFSREQATIQIKNITVTNSSYFDTLLPTPCVNDVTREYQCAGSGMLFYYSDTIREFHSYPNSTVLEILGCTFSRNWNQVPVVSVPTVVSALNDPTVKRLPFNGGGAIGVIYNQSLARILTNISNSTFMLSGGYAYGAVFVLFVNMPSSGIVNFADCIFEGGFSFIQSYSGGDIVVYFKYLLSSHDTRHECLRIERSDFHVPRASYPQKHAHIALIQLSESPATCDVVLSESTCHGNSPSAVSHGCLFAFALGATNNLNIEMIDFKLNAQYGAFKFVNLGRVKMRGTGRGVSVLEGATSSLIDAYATDLYLKGNITFRNNHAEYGSGGGALLLQADSHLFLEEPLELVFENNHATYGGAIYAVESDAPFCTFQYITRNDVSCKDNCTTKLDINVTFVNNTAELAGNSIYVDPLYSCDLILTSKLKVDQTHLPKLYASIFNFPEPSTNHLPEMSSTANVVCFCDVSENGTVGHVCNGSSQYIPNGVAFPGKNVSVWMLPIDSNNVPVYSIVSSAPSQCSHSSPRQCSGSSPNQKWELHSNDAIIQFLGVECKEVVYTLYSKQEVTTTADVCISVQPVRMRTIGPKLTQSKCFGVSMTPCPLGFKHDSHGGCECNGLLSKHKSTCYTSSGLTTVPANSWVGPFRNYSDKVGFSTSCPSGYCKTNTNLINISDPSALCAHGRTGVMCGKCPDHLSVVFGSTYCKPCSNLWLLTIAVYALAGIVIVVLLLLLRMTVADGIVNGLVFYANVLSTNLLIFLDHRSLQWLLTFISLLNLDLGFLICFYNGMDNLAKAYFQFVFPVYLWSITGLVTVMSRYSVTISKLSSSYSVPVLATLIFLSYSKLLRAAIEGLTSADVEIETVNGTTSKMTVWYFDGNIEYSTGAHIGLFVLSLITLLLFVLPYTLLLTAAPFLLRFNVVNYFKPMIDAYCGPYKDKQRFWFGARLCVLLVIFSADAILKGRNDSLLLYIEAVILAVCVYIQAMVNPYKNKLVYVIDTFLLVNCFLLTSYGAFLHTSDRPPALYIGAGILVGLVFVVFFLIIAYYIRMRMPAINVVRRNKKTIVTEDTSNSDYYEPIHGSTFYSSDKLREPLLEDY